MTKFKCIGCGVEKPLDRFYSEYSHRGHTKYCKECIGKRKKEYYENNPDKVEERKQARKKDKIGCLLRQRKYTENNREVINERSKKQYYANREQYIAYAKTARLLNKDREYAHGVIKNALKFGKINRPELCSACGGKTAVQAHHENYEKPLEVIWLCRSCHSLQHRGVFEKGNIV